MKMKMRTTEACSLRAASHFHVVYISEHIFSGGENVFLGRERKRLLFSHALNKDYDVGGKNPSEITSKRECQLSNSNLFQPSSYIF
jgi:hypothetical protein